MGLGWQRHAPKVAAAVLFAGDMRLKDDFKSLSHNTHPDVSFDTTCEALYAGSRKMVYVVGNVFVGVVIMNLSKKYKYWFSNCKAGGLFGTPAIYLCSFLRPCHLSLKDFQSCEYDLLLGYPLLEPFRLVHNFVEAVYPGLQGGRDRDMRPALSLEPSNLVH